jgi:hypothetical protein
MLIHIRNPNYVSADFHGHLRERHATKLPVDPVAINFSSYASKYDAGDVIGCG